MRTLKFYILVEFYVLRTFSQAHKHPTVCRWWRGRKEYERGGLLTWLEWLLYSCAIICGGALRAALQHHAVLLTSQVPSAVI